MSPQCTEGLSRNLNPPKLLHMSAHNQDTRKHSHQNKSDTYHQTTSSDSHKVPDIRGHMIILNEVDLSVRKEEQDVCHDAAGGERDEGKTQRPGEGQRTHLHTEQKERAQAAVIRDRKVGWLDGGVEGF